MNWLHRIGVFGLGLFALTSVWKTAPGHIGIALCLPAVALALWQRRRLPWDAASALTALVALWLCARYALQTWGGMAEPGLLTPKEVFIDWLFVPMFALLAILPCEDPVRRLRRLWMLAMLGFTFGVISYLWQRGLGVLWSGERLGFHLNRALGVGLYAGAFAVALIATARLWWSVAGTLRWPARIAGIALIALNLEVLLTAQNRSTYLALAIVAAGAVAIAVWRTLRNRNARPGQRRLALGLIGALVAGLLLAGNLDAVQKRIEHERGTIQTVLTDGLDAAPAASVTVRLRLWRYVLQRFPDAPLLGHGFGDVKDIIDRDVRPVAALNEGERYDQVHNSYLQTLWGQGLIGTALWIALSLVLIRDAVRAARTDRQRQMLLPAMWAVLAFTAVWAVFDYRLSHPDMRFFSILLLLSLRLLGQRESTGRLR
ncbi:O-antigen ligase family protein [Denitromonas sp.]|uniref:O-antigen ligase family protein n=1 Tax=Denitromonas sp. TaxID=2734609 RepID=UPI002AFE56F6|nr:O-antigen ligase family protein [Denitromonas sp.]